MLRKVIHYTDFDGKEQQTVAYFNLNKTECVDMNLEYEADGGLIGHLKQLMAAQRDGEELKKPAVDFIKLIIEKSYGVRPKYNPSLFLKEDENGKPLFRKFKQSAAYDKYVFDLLSGDESLDEFAAGVMPQISEEQQAEAQKMLEEEGLGDIVSSGIHEV
jgi:hypothetical protein